MDILRREHFDWAEDVEDELSSSAAEITSQSLPVEDPYEPYELDNTSWSEGSDDSYYSHYNEAEASLEALYSSGYDTPLTINGEEEEFDAYDERSDPSAVMRGNVNNEFAFRNFYVAAEDSEFRAHHFNWMGCPVYQHSSTPPAVSLAFMLADPKIPRPSDEFRMQAILGCGTTFIDPVMVHIDEVGEELFQLRGSELVRACAGRVLKYYTAHGQWVTDTREETGQTTLDDGSFLDYVAPGLAIGNGFVDTSPIRSRAEWKQCQEDLARSRVFSTGKLRGWKPNPSPLRVSMTIADLEAEEATAKESPTTFDQILQNVSQSMEKPDEPLATEEPDARNEGNPESSSSKTSQRKSAKKRRGPLLHVKRRRPAPASAPAPAPTPEQPPPDSSKDPNFYFSFPGPEPDKPTKKLKPSKLCLLKKLCPRNLLKRALGAIFVSGFGSLDLNQVQP